MTAPCTDTRVDRSRPDGPPSGGGNEGYTDDSALAAAAVHAGLLKNAVAGEGQTAVPKSVGF